MRTWNAEGLLQQVYDRVGGRKRLAELTGIREETLSQYSGGGRPLGRAHADLIVEALNTTGGPEVTIYDLGAPTREEEAAAAVTVLERLDTLEAAYAELTELLAERERPAAAATGRRRRERTSEPRSERDRDPREDALPALEPDEDRGASR